MSVRSPKGFLMCYRFVLSILVGAVLLPAAAHAQRGSDRPALVDVVALEQRSLAPVALVPGTVVSRDDVRVAAEVAGILRSVPEVGDRFGQGEVMATVDDARLRLQRLEQAADVDRVQANLEYLNAELDRFSQLENSAAVSRNQLDQIRSRARVAQNELAVAKARLAQIDDELGRTRIKAPVDGVVVSRLAQAGERVSVGDAVVRLVNPDRLEVIARPPLENYRFVTPGDELLLKIDDREMTAPVRTKVSLGDEQTHVFELRLDIPADSLPSGKTLRVQVPTGGSNEVLAVPRDALVLRAGSSAIFVVGGDGQARRVDVITGVASGEWIEVQGDGLGAGDLAVVRGNERLRDGQSVTIRDGGGGTAEMAPIGSTF